MEFLKNYKYGILLALAVVIGIIFLLAVSRSDEKDVFSRDLKQRKKERRKNKILVSIDNIVKAVPLFTPVLQWIEAKYRRICPYDDAYLVKLAGKNIGLSVLASGIAAVAILAVNRYLEGRTTIYSLCCVGLAAVILSVEVVKAQIKAAETRFMNEFVRYLTAVKHNYYVSRNIPQSILDASDERCYEVRKHANAIYDLMTGIERKERIRAYGLSQNANAYIKMFLVQAYEASERGDVVDSNGSLFANNVEFLRMEMMRTSVRKKKEAAAFSGYAAVAALPVFFMALVKNWGLSFSDTMSIFYSGVGNFVMAGTFMATVFSYLGVSVASDITAGWGKRKSMSGLQKLIGRNEILKRITERIEKKRDFKFRDRVKKMSSDVGETGSIGAFFISMVLWCFLTTSVSTGFFLYVHYDARENLLSSVPNMDQIAPLMNKAQKEKLEGVVLEIVAQHKDEQGFTITEAKNELLMAYFIPNASVVEMIAEEIIKIIFRYQQEVLHWYEIIISFLIGCAGSLFPYVSLSYRHHLYEAQRTDELRQFQAIIIMERLFPESSASSLLEEMETFSVIYKTSLNNCINNYSAGPRDALLALREAEKQHTEFVDLVDEFLSVEDIGVREAFSEVKNDRDMSESIRELQAEVEIGRKKDVAEIISMIPMAFVAGGYFIVPFVLDTIDAVMEVFTLMEGM